MNLTGRREALLNDLLAFVTAGRGCFNALADAVCDWQSTAIPAYGRLVKSRAWAGGWRTAPLVPTSLYRDLDLTAASPRPLAATFRTSGTTGEGLRGTRRVPDLTLYHAAMVQPFVDYVLAGDRTPTLWWSLIPAAHELPDSSLSHMTSALSEMFASEVVRTRPTSREPVVVMTTAFALMQHLDATGPEAPPLAPGSRMMLTGGFKGRSRELDETALMALIEARLGIPPDDVVAEYGMTELTSQAYGRPLVGPPWLKIRVVDPATGADLEPGQRGLVAFFDLLNLDNVSAVLTSDLGVLDRTGGLQLLGRAPGAILRGCSLTAEERGLAG